MTVFEHLRRGVLERSGLSDAPKRFMPPLPELRKIQWSESFESMMRSRLLMGAFRYGLMSSPSNSAFDVIGDMPRRIERFQATGNGELLADIANLALLAFHHKKHPRFHVRGEDDGQHVELEKGVRP